MNRYRKPTKKVERARERGWGGGCARRFEFRQAEKDTRDPVGCFPGSAGPGRMEKEKRVHEVGSFPRVRWRGDILPASRDSWEMDQRIAYQGAT